MNKIYVNPFKQWIKYNNHLVSKVVNISPMANKADCACLQKYYFGP